MSSSRFLVVALAAALVMAVGCQDKDKDHHMKSGSEKAAMMDACSHCAGVQTATADGKCPACKMDVSKAAMMDACSHCAGVQTATADGKCPVCKMDVAKPAAKSPSVGGTTSASSPEATKTADVCSHCAGVQVATAEGKCPGCGAQVVQKQ
jgi:hypothetical protein